MFRISLLVALLACSGSESAQRSNGSSTSGDDSPVRGDDSPAAASSVPSSFSIRQVAGPVRPPRDYVQRQTSVEPSGSGFVLVVRDGDDEVVRTEIAASELEPIYEIVVSRRAELSAECINPNIREGTVRRFYVTLDGEEVEFRCTNSATPAFEALAEAFDDLAITNTPAH